MVDENILGGLSKEKITEVGAGTLADLLTVTIEGDTPVQRMENYLVQVGNPYCVRVGQTPVRLLFHNEERTLSEKLRSYFLSLKNSDF